MRTSPKRWRPCMNQSSSAGFGWVEKMDVKARWVCSGSASPPASIPRKCGAKTMVGVSPSSSCSAPCSCTRDSTTSRGADHSQLRSSQVWQNTTKVSRAQARRWRSDTCGKHSSRLRSATRRRGATSTYSTWPSSQPSARSQESGRCASRRMNHKPSRAIMAPPRWQPWKPCRRCRRWQARRCSAAPRHAAPCSARSPTGTAEGTGG